MRVGFHPDGGGYWIDDGLAREDEPRFLERRYDHDAVFRGVEISECVLGDGDELAYLPTGRASTAMRVVLVYAGEDREIRLDERSGHVEILGTTSGFRDTGF